VELERLLGERRRRVEREGLRRIEREAVAVAARRERLRQAVPGLVRVRFERLRRCRAELERLSPSRQLGRRGEVLADRSARVEAAALRCIRQRSSELGGRQVAGRLQRALRLRFAQAGAAVEQRRQRLTALSPDAVLQRGYSITWEEESGRVLRAATETAAGRRVRVRLGAGELVAGVEAIDA